MTRRFRSLLIGSICGSLLGAALVSSAFKVQGGVGQSFAIIGAVGGGIAGVLTITRQLRLHVLGADIGSIAALTLFQVPVCDGSHFVMPAIGGVIGRILGAIPESILDRKTERAAPATNSDAVQSTNKAMDTKGSIDAL